MELYRILQIIKKRLRLIILIPLIFTSISAIISYFYLTPQYKATTTLIVGKNNENESQRMQYNDVLMYQKLVKTYVEIAKSKKVAEETVKRLSLEIFPEELLGNLTATPAADTEVLYISYVSKNRDEAAFVANGLALVFIERSKELLKTENVQVIDYAKVPSGPFKPRGMVNTAIGFFLGIMVSLGLVFLLEYMDSTIKSIEEVEELLDLPVVGIVPYTK